MGNEKWEQIFFVFEKAKERHEQGRREQAVCGCNYEASIPCLKSKTNNLKFQTNFIPRTLFRSPKVMQ
jgi:hypothetical protein